MSVENELKLLREVFCKLRKEGKILVALLYASYASGTLHIRSDINLGLFIRARNVVEEMEIIDTIAKSFC